MALTSMAIAATAAAAMLQYRADRKEPEPEYVFFYAENQGEAYPTTLGAYRFAELVEEKTKGRIRILVQAEGTLGAEDEVIDQMRYGGIDFARVSLSQLSEYIPELRVLMMPYLYTDSQHMWRVLDGEIGEQFLESVSQNRLVGLSWYDAGARNFYSTSKPIACLEDIAGMRIRVQESELMADTVEALGAVAVPMAYAEVYSALERGIVDGAENNWSSYESMSHYEAAPYYTVDEHMRVPEIQICAQHTWEKLTEEDRRIILECAKESALYERELWKEQEEISKQIVTQRGTKVVELSLEERKRFQEAMEGVYEKYCRDQMDLIDRIIGESAANEKKEKKKGVTDRWR